MARPDRKDRKGKFGPVGLPVAKRYLRPLTRNRAILAGAAVAAVVLAVGVASYFTRDGGILSNGPLSTSHANLEGDCANCHDPFGKVAAAGCSTCHEKFGDELGVYTYKAHYLYRSNDFSRLTPSPHEVECAACHPEHRGREIAITDVPDARCLPCHDFGSFNTRHPQFEFVAHADTDDDAGIAFPHVHHVREVMKRQKLVDVEKACLYCHNARPDGKSFEPIDFDRHCDACHLTAGEATPVLPVQDAPGDPPGVETLEAIRRRGGPGSQWAIFTPATDFQRLGPRVRKRPVFHRDPWILANLRHLRQELYPDAGLADLLTASADAPANELPALYQEALTTLESYAQGLRGRPEPEIRAELEKIDAALAELRRAIADPYTPLDETDFQLALDRPRPGLSDEQRAEIEGVVDELTKPCSSCHRIERATIARVQKDQRTLRRAEFDHRAHILQVRCLECHTRIPILDHLQGDEKVDPKIDNSAIQNLPGIERCQECHKPDLASNRCINCHLFHPNKSRRSQLLLYLDEPAPDTPPAPQGAEG